MSSQVVDTLSHELESIRTQIRAARDEAPSPIRLLEALEAAERSILETLDAVVAAFDEARQLVRNTPAYHRADLDVVHLSDALQDRASDARYAQEEN